MIEPKLSFESLALLECVHCTPMQSINIRERVFLVEKTVLVQFLYTKCVQIGLKTHLVALTPLHTLLYTLTNVRGYV